MSARCPHTHPLAHRQTSGGILVLRHYNHIKRIPVWFSVHPQTHTPKRFDRWPASGSGSWSWDINVRRGSEKHLWQDRYHQTMCWAKFKVPQNCQCICFCSQTSATISEITMFILTLVFIDLSQQTDLWCYSRHNHRQKCHAQHTLMVIHN